jgi:hypothetical protein
MLPVLLLVMMVSNDPSYASRFLLVVFMMVPHARLLPTWFDQATSVGTTIYLLFDSSRRPASLSLCGVVRFVLDGVVDEVSFGPPPTHFANFLSSDGVCHWRWGYWSL